MKRWWLVIALMLSLGVNLGIVVSRLVPPRDRPSGGETADAGEEGGETTDAERPVAPAERPMPRVVLRMADELGLEGEKRESFVALQRSFLRRTLIARGEAQRAQERLRLELLAPRPDREAVAESLERMSAARTELERAFVDNVLDTRELLDPEQTRRFLRMIARLRHAREQLQRRFQRPGLPGANRPRLRPPGG